MLMIETRAINISINFFKQLYFLSIFLIDVMT